MEHHKDTGQLHHYVQYGLSESAQIFGCAKEHHILKTL